MVKKKRVIGVRVLPGEPTNGSGKVCIHLFIPDPNGPFVEPCVQQVKMVATDKKEGEAKIVAAPARGRLACDPKRLVAPREVKGVTHITLRTDDPRAATCPACLASPDYQRIMQVLNENVR